MAVTAGPDTAFCNGGTVQLNAAGFGATSFSWNPSGGLSCTGCPNPVATVSATSTYVVTVSNGSCSGTDTVTIIVSQPPIVSLDGPDTLCTNYQSPFVFTGSAQPGSYYVWNVDGIPVVPGGAGPDIGTVNITWSAPGIKKVKLDVTAAGCPPSSDSVTVFLEECSVRVPNIMVPDGDGKNDRFYILGLEKHPESRLVIYNRWGLKIYESSDYKNDWEGTHNGKKVPDGVYYYILHLKDGTEDHGFVTIIGTNNP
jgi:gliding motility-associated-like protein